MTYHSQIEFIAARLHDENVNSIDICVPIEQRIELVCEFHNFDIDPTDYDWIEGIMFQMQGNVAPFGTERDEVNWFGGKSPQDILDHYYNSMYDIDDFDTTANGRGY